MSGSWNPERGKGKGLQPVRVVAVTGCGSRVGRVHTGVSCADSLQIHAGAILFSATTMDADCEVIRVLSERLCALCMCCRGGVGTMTHPAVRARADGLPGQGSDLTYRSKFCQSMGRWLWE